jgi:FKBP-type peptidyl-prolyl cis-trans isomerase FkpA
MAVALFGACAPATPARTPATASPPPAQASVLGHEWDVAAQPEPDVIEEPGAPPEPAPEPRTGSQRWVDPDGLEVEEIALGAGQSARAGDRVLVHYDGMLPDGTPIDSSRKRGQPLELVLGRGMLIVGFERALEGMRAGGIRRATIPPKLGYGARAAGGKIPPHATLVFEIELLEIR